MALQGQTLPRAQRLRGKIRLNEMFETGLLGKSRLVLVRALQNGAGFTRAAAIVGKAAGNAVKRNRLRRRIRAAFRTHKAGLPAGWDFVLLARKGALEADFASLCSDMETAVRRALENGSP